MTTSGNKAGWSGEMYYEGGGSPTVTNRTFSGNTADFGGRMYSRV